MQLPLSCLRSVAGGGDDDWGAFEGDDAAAAPTALQNGFAGAGWASFEAAAQPAAIHNGLTPTAATGLAAVTAPMEDAGHRRGVSADTALPEDLFSEPVPAAAQKSQAAEAAGGGDVDDDDFGDFADAEPVPPSPALQQSAAGANGPGLFAQPAALQQGLMLHGPPRPPLSPPGLAGGTAGGPSFAAAFPDSLPESTPLHHAGIQFSSAAHLNGVAAGSGAGPAPMPASVPAAAHPLQQEAPAAETSREDDFADFGDFADATRDSGSNGAVPQHAGALQHRSPSVSPVKPTSKSIADTVGSVGGWFPAAALAAPQAAQHRRGVSRCAWRSCEETPLAVACPYDVLQALLVPS